MIRTAILAGALIAALGLPAFAQTPASITTPDEVQSSLGTAAHLEAGVRIRMTS